MESGVDSGLIGGALAVAIVTYLSSKMRAKPSDGTLKWGWGLFFLGSVCTLFVVLAVAAFFFDDDIWTSTSEFLSAVGLIIGFGFGALYCYGDYFATIGTYDDQGIQFYTPWTGKKVETWNDLESVEFSASMSWYVLRFSSGKVIRLPTLISGIGGILDILEESGYIDEE